MMHLSVYWNWPIVLQILICFLLLVMWTFHLKWLNFWHPSKVRWSSFLRLLKPIASFMILGLLLWFQLYTILLDCEWIIISSCNAISSIVVKRSLQTLACKILHNGLICSLEYLNKNWTYHSKGLWLFRKNSPESLVTIGSPNFGMRSYFRDMESQLYMISESPNYILSDSLL